jgi:hypothetical protein
MEDEKLIAERETICKGLLSGGNISSLRDWKEAIVTQA